MAPAPRFSTSKSPPCTVVEGCGSEVIASAHDTIPAGSGGCYPIETDPSPPKAPSRSTCVKSWSLIISCDDGAGAACIRSIGDDPTIRASEAPACVIII
jgi:hypothetical protein